MLTQSEIRNLTNYNEETGEFTWSDSAHKKVKGKPVGSMSRNGYLVTKIYYKRYMVHRLIWLYVYGSFPVNDIDHINRVRNDNRISNLRDVCRHINNHNRSDLSNCKSGHVGVRQSMSGRWQAYINIKGKFIGLGVHDTIEQAAFARRKYKKQFCLG